MRTTTAGSGKGTIGLWQAGSARVLERVVAGERPVEAGLVEAADDHLVLLGVADALGEGEARGGEEHRAEREEGLHPRVGRQVVDGDDHGEQGDPERGGGLEEEGAGVLLGAVRSSHTQIVAAGHSGPDPSGHPEATEYGYSTWDS